MLLIDCYSLEIQRGFVLLLLEPCFNTKAKVQLVKAPKYFWKSLTNYNLYVFLEVCSILQPSFWITTSPLVINFCTYMFSIIYCLKPFCLLLIKKVIMVMCYFGSKFLTLNTLQTHKCHKQCQTRIASNVAIDCTSNKIVS